MVTSPWRTWLSASVLNPSGASCVAYLQQHGYSGPIASAYLHAVGHFAHWLTEEQVTLRCLDESAMRRFLTAHLPNCRCPGRCQRTVVIVQAALGHLLDVLRADGRIAARRVGRSPAIHDELERFTSYLEQVCGLGATTRAGRRRWVEQFLADRFGRGPLAIDRLTPRDIVDFLGRHGTHYTPGTAGVRACALRSYLRFRAARSADRVDALLAAIPTVASWRLASLPSYLTPDETARFLKAFDRRHASGQRGYAMARCLLDLGLRASEVATLQLDDLNWQDGTVRVGAGKSRRADVLPLPVLTGRAIVAYLRQSRPSSTSRAVFVRDRAPLDAPITREIVRNAVRRAFARCGLGARYTGTHVLRRTTATQMRLAGASLKEIADVLRHRSLDTTTIYTKLDRPQLATVAAPWPGGVS
jgi:site-specific recombinase XerD